MDAYPAWHYDEMKQVGKDYNDATEVEAYDGRHGAFRDVEKENEAILEALDVKPEHIIIDIGSGTGAFALQAARKCTRVYAVDISEAMLEYAKKKSGAAGITNIIFCHGGFLTYAHTAPPVDAIVTNTALHHLPDFWKGVALQRLNKMLKIDGQLFLSDIVLEQRNIDGNIARLIETVEKKAGPEVRKDIEAHIRNEYSTYDWIMDGLLEHAGFEITSKVIAGGVIGRYRCRKKED